MNDTILELFETVLIILVCPLALLFIEKEGETNANLRDTEQENR